MHSFYIYYNDQPAMVQQLTDANQETFYMVRFEDGTELELTPTPDVDGMGSGWAEVSGEKTELAMTIGELIEEHEM